MNADDPNHPARLLALFVFHWKRRNLCPYQDATVEFQEQIDDLCRRAEEHLEHPVNPFKPLPGPRNP